MQVYQTDGQGVYVGVAVADQDPLDAGNWLIPAGCVTEPPPTLSEKQQAQWVDGAWAVLTIPDPIEPEPVPEFELTGAMQKAYRASAYRAEADPLFFKAQRGEATMDEWLALVAEIKMRYPYPT
jgi:hypothetical protein